LTWGKDVEFLQKRAAAGKPTPALENMPELYEDLGGIWALFWQLHKSRQSGFGPGPLSIQDIVAAIGLYQMPEPVECFELIVAMDQEWLNWAVEQNSKEK